MTPRIPDKDMSHIVDMACTDTPPPLGWAAARKIDPFRKLHFAGGWERIVVEEQGVVLCITITSPQKQL